MNTAFGTGFGGGEKGNAAGRTAAEQALSEMRSDEADFTVVFCSPTYDCEEVIDGVQSIVGEAELVGATAEGKFTEQGVSTSAFSDEPGVIVALVASDEMRFFTGIGRDVSENPEASVAQASANLPSSVEGYPHLTGLLLSSAIFGREELALRVYQELPIQWAGGGANDLSLENLAVFTGEEVATDGVVLTVIASKRPFALGVGNRHEPIGGTYEVTKSDGNTVYELDGRPAYEVWKEAFAETAEEEYGFAIDEIENDYKRSYQAFSEMVFGLKTGDDEYKVRSPFMTGFFEPYANVLPDTSDGTQIGDQLSDLPTLGTLPEGALYFEHPVPEGVVLHSMTSGREGTIDRGSRSARHALTKFAGDSAAGGLVFECPCGEATLQEEYPKLIEAVSDPIDAPIAGIQSGGGEVCLRRDDMRGVHETSTTVLLFPGGGSA